MSVSVVDSGKNYPSTHMQKDRELLHSAGKSDWSLLLHFYEWPVFSITYGHFLHIENYFTLAFLDQQKKYIAKRPSGGGITLHQGDFTLSFLISCHSPLFTYTPSACYQYIHQHVLQALLRWHPSLQLSLQKKESKSSNDSLGRIFERFCSAHIVPYDLLLQENGRFRKVGGAAQKRMRNVVLHQMTLSLFPLSIERIRGALRVEKKKELCERMEKNSGSLSSCFSIVESESVRKELQKYLIDYFKKVSFYEPIQIIR